MKRFMPQPHKRSFRFRMMLGVLAVWFAFQTNAVFCACLQGDSGLTGIVSASSEGMPSQGNMPKGCCHPVSSNDESQPADSGADTCPLCQISATCSTTEQKNITLSSSSLPTVEPILLVSRTFSSLNGSLDIKCGFCLDPRQLYVQSSPIFVLNSTFLI
jgi:hypothetical protein